MSAPPKFLFFFSLVSGESILIDSLDPFSIWSTDKTAADIAAKALQNVISKAVKGANLLELCREGDKLIEEACSLVYNKDKKNPTQKGIAFPCTLSINKCVSFFSSFYKKNRTQH